MNKKTAEQVADRYIGRDGGPPLTVNNVGFTISARTKQQSDDLIAVSNFIAWHDMNHIQGNVAAQKALEAFGRIVGIRADLLYRVARDPKSIGPSTK